MVFHLGALWRLNELGFLPKLDRVSSVSGGSITAGVLGLKWSQLDFSATGTARGFAREVVAPIRKMAAKTLDVGDVLKGFFLTGTVAEQVAKSYRSHLFGAATLQDLPDRPRFVINATNVQTGALWRFSKKYMADFMVACVLYVLTRLKLDLTAYPKLDVWLAASISRPAAQVARKLRES